MKPISHWRASQAHQQVGSIVFGPHPDAAGTKQVERRLLLKRLPSTKLKQELRDTKELAIKLAQYLSIMVDCCDYTAGACRPTEMVGAVLSKDILVSAKEVLKKRLDPFTPI